MYQTFLVTRGQAELWFNVEHLENHLASENVTCDTSHP